MFFRHKSIISTNPVYGDFLALAMKGAGLCSEAKLSPCPKWQEIYRLASEQAVIGVVASAVPDDVQELFFDDTLSIVRRNKEINEMLASVATLLYEHGVTFMVQKGQGIAQYYPNPMMRMSGDIDLLLSPSDYAEARRILSPRADHIGNECQGKTHLDFMFGDIDIELHSSEFCNRNDHSQQTFNDILSHVFTQDGMRQWTSFRCEGVEIKMAPYTFDAFYLFIHAVKHYYSSGIGLRQLLDMQVFLQKNRDHIDRAQLLSWVDSMGLRAEWNAFEAMWRKPDSRLWDIIFSDGNFGRVKDEKQAQRDAVKAGAPRGNIFQRIRDILRSNYRDAYRYLPISRRLFLNRLYHYNRLSLRDKLHNL